MSCPIAPSGTTASSRDETHAAALAQAHTAEAIAIDTDLAMHYVTNGTFGHAAD